MTSRYDTSSWRDDLDLEPGVHPTIAFALHAMRGSHAAALGTRLLAPNWPFPAELIPTDRRQPPPTLPDAEDAPC